MKGLVLAAGEGTRLSELNLEHKSFATVNKKHIIDYSLDLLSQKNNGGERICSEIIIVVGYHADSIKRYVGSSYKGVPVKYVIQSERKGIAHAVAMAKQAIDDDFIMCLADEILFEPKLAEMVKSFYDNNVECMCGVIYDGTDFSMKPIAYEVDNNRVVAVTEKPTEYHNDIRGVGECIFSKSSLNYLDELKPNSLRGEYEMGDWIRLILEATHNVSVFEIAKGYKNINYAKDIKSAEDAISKYNIC